MTTDAPIDNLCHEVRNGTASIGGMAKHIPNSGLRLNILKQCARIEQALIKYEVCECGNSEGPTKAP